MPFRVLLAVRNVIALVAPCWADFAGTFVTSGFGPQSAMLPHVIRALNCPPLTLGGTVGVVIPILCSSLGIRLFIDLSTIGTHGNG